MSSFKQTPLVLVHGFLGYDQLKLPGETISYFRGVPEALTTAGYTVPELPKLNSGGSVKERAADLKKYLETDRAVKGRQVHLIAYSMGGLDCRFMISRLGMADRVLSLTSLGVPHRGTPLADLGLSIFGSLVKAIDSARILDLRGFFDLTVRNNEEFGREEVPDAANVRYYSVAGLYHPDTNNTCDLLGPTHDYIKKKEGENDGLVSVRSATYGTFLGTWPGNHLRMTNWATNLVEPIEELHDHSVIDRYLALVQHLEQEMP